MDLAPFAYLNERYDGDLAVLWVDAHSDLFSKEVMPNSHAHVIGTLLGEGDAPFRSAVKRPIKPGHAMIAGWQRLPARYAELRAFEDDVAERHQVRRVTADQFANNSEPVLAWLRETGVKHVAVHFDVDILDATLFRSLTFTRPGRPVPTDNDIRAGQATLPQIVRLLTDVAKEADVVGLGITELTPRDAIALQKALADLPLLGRSA